MEVGDWWCIERGEDAMLAVVVVVVVVAGRVPLFTVTATWKKFKIGYVILRSTEPNLTDDGLWIKKKYTINK